MFDGKLTEFCRRVNQEVREKGFWDSTHRVLSLLGKGYPGEDMGDNFLATKNAFISQKIALIMSECGEALEAMRNVNYGLERKDTFEDELADVFIRLADLCGELDIDIERQIDWKLRYNIGRKTKHGKIF